MSDILEHGIVVMKKIGFYSPHGGTFKTTITLLSGLILASSGIRTIIVEFDTDSPALMRIMDGKTVLWKLVSSKGHELQTYNVGDLSIPIVPVGGLHDACLAKKVVEPSYWDIVTRRYNRKVLYTIMSTLEKLARRNNAEVLLFDLGRGFNILTLSALQFMDSLAIIGRGDEVSLEVLKGSLMELSEKFIKRDVEDYPIIRLAITSYLPDLKDCDRVSEDAGEKYRNIVRELAMLGIPIMPTEIPYIIPIIPELLTIGAGDPVEVTWSKRQEPPYCSLFNSIYELVKSLLY